MLQCAAVIGEQVPRGLLEAVTDLGGDELQAALGRLRRAEFLEEQTLFPEPAYGFRHSLTHDVAYGSLLHDRRRALHRRVLAALEAHHGDDVDEIVGPLAHHAMHAERWAQAVALRAAGRAPEPGEPESPRGGGVLRAGARRARPSARRPRAPRPRRRPARRDGPRPRAVGRAPADRRDPRARRRRSRPRSRITCASRARSRSCAPRTRRSATPRARSMPASARWPSPSAWAPRSRGSWPPTAWAAPSGRSGSTAAPSCCCGRT